MDTTKKIIFNHYYRLRHDEKRSFLLSHSSPNSLQIKDGFVDLDWVSKIHPIYAMIFSFLSEADTIENFSKEVAYFLDITEEAAIKMIIPFLNNEQPFYTEYNGVTNNFPRNLIIKEDEAFTNPQQYSPELFVYDELDMARERWYKAPLGITFMINNTCATDCVYCYADKRDKKKTISFNALKKLISNAKELQLKYFTITGGEFFLFKEWRELLSELKQNEFDVDLISTKVPLKEQDVIDIKQFNIRVQVSLDSLDCDVLSEMLAVNNEYAEKIKNTIQLLDNHNVRFQIATILTKHNDKIDNLEKIYRFLSTLKNITRWEIRVGFKSLYGREDFDSMKISQLAINNIDQWVAKINEKTKINILWVPNGTDKYFKGENGSKNFFGSRCSANYSNLVVLPDGKATICEQLYWDPRFIIGDVVEQSIEEIWNSPRALKLSFPAREDFRSVSVCKTCEIFDECFAYPNKCFADVLKGYGMENWDYPDPRCIRAPKFIDDLLHN